MRVTQIVCDQCGKATTTATLQLKSTEMDGLFEADLCDDHAKKVMDMLKTGRIKAKAGRKPTVQIPGELESVSS